MGQGSGPGWNEVDAQDMETSEAYSSTEDRTLFQALRQLRLDPHDSTESAPRSRADRALQPGVVSHAPVRFAVDAVCDLLSLQLLWNGHSLSLPESETTSVVGPTGHGCRNRSGLLQYSRCP